jgi:hypothetical protein
VAFTLHKKLPSGWHPLWRLFLLLFALFNLTRLVDVQEPLGPNRAVDFRNVYVGSQLLWQGENPYDDELLKAHWKEIIAAEDIPFTTQPGLPVTPLLYPPWALGLFGLIAFLPYKIAYLIWYLLIPIMLALAVFWGGSWVMGKKPEGWGWLLDMGLLCLAFKGSVHAWVVGQPSFLAYTLLFGALYFDKKGKIWTAGLLLGLAAFKPTLAIPFGLLLLAKRRWWTLGFGAAVWVLTEAVVMAVQPNFVGLHSAYLTAASAFRELVFSPEMDNYPIHYIMTHLTELTVWFEYVHEGGHSWYPWLVLAFLPLIGWVFWKKWQRKSNDQDALLLFLLGSFLINYFSFYDLWVLLPFVLLYDGLGRWKPFFCWMLWLPLIIPFHGVLDKLGLPGSFDFLYLLTPGIVLAWLMVWIRHSTKNSNPNSKNQVHIQ